MTIAQIQKLEEIKETLERLQIYINKETSHVLLNSKREYIKDMFSNIDNMIDDMYPDTPDLWDAGLNDFDYENASEE